MLEFARNAPIDASYLRDVVDRLASTGSSAMGFRATGTPEDREVAEFVCDEMRSIGLTDVGLETTPVDGWRFADARVSVIGGGDYQCASMGDLHHAIAAGRLTLEGVHGELGDLITARRPGRRSTEEITVFDSTGTALEDVAAAAIVYEKAVAAGVGIAVDLGS